MRRPRPRVGWLVIVCLSFPVGGRAQTVSWSPEAGPLFEPLAATSTVELIAPRQDAAQTAVRPMLLSLVLPGAGQHVLGQRRKGIYLALEVLAWSFYVERRLAGSDLRDEYRDFAWAQARIQSGPRVDGSFGYYETLSQWTRSGAFDTDAGTLGIQPEADPSTFNGWIWNRAVLLFIPGGGPVPESDPRYQAALAYYFENGYSTEFLWDWTGTGTAQQEFGGLIERSDSRFKHATNLLGVILANHVISAADAYLSARGAAAELDLRVTPTRGPGGPGWSALLAVATPW